MSEVITKLVVDLSKPEGHPDRVKSIPLTKAELAERATMQAEAEARRVAEEAEAQRLADLKSSARTKLVAGEPLTAEEAALLIA